MPRPILRESFGMTYRKIPVLLVGRDLYVDTSIICEALEHFFPAKDGYNTLYPPAADGKNHRSMIRGFASYWTDRALFRVTTGLIPSSVWRTRFGTDRSNLIGHKLDPDKLEKKLSFNKSNLDLQLSLLEPLFHDAGDWIFSTSKPSLADITLYYQLNWGERISAGQGINDLTGGEAPDTNNDVIGDVFNRQRYPGLYQWYTRAATYLDSLPQVETRAKNPEQVLGQVAAYQTSDDRLTVLPTPASQLSSLDHRNGLAEGALVAVAPDDTGVSSPSIGTLVSLTPEEVTIKPQRLENPAKIDVNMHFPRLGFTVRPVNRSRL